MAQPQKAILQAALEGCSALDFSGWFAPTSVKIMSYDISEGKVVTSQNVADLSSRVFTALPDLSDAYVLTRDAPTQLEDGEIILSPGSAASLCLHPIVEEPMKCVDNDDVGTWEVTPTAIDDNCVVLSFNQWYAEPSEHDCESSFCQGECVRDAHTAVPTRACVAVECFLRGHACLSSQQSA